MAKKDKKKPEEEKTSTEKVCTDNKSCEKVYLLGINKATGKKTAIMQDTRENLEKYIEHTKTVGENNLAFSDLEIQ